MSSAAQNSSISEIYEKEIKKTSGPILIIFSINWSRFTRTFNQRRFWNLQFLVACTRLYNPLCLSDGRSETPFLTFLGGFCITAPAQILDLFFFFITAPFHPRTTREAVYPALLVKYTERQRWSCPPVNPSVCTVGFEE